MTINQQIKWARKLAEGKGDKYYPKALIPAVARIGLTATEKLKAHYAKRKENYLKEKEITEFDRK